MRWDMLVVPLGITACSTPGMVDIGCVGMAASDSRPMSRLCAILDNNA